MGIFNRAEANALKHRLQHRAMKDQTKAIHSSKAGFPPFRPVNFPIYYTSTFEFRDIEHMRKVFSKGSHFPRDMREEYVYTRGGNPTQRALEDTVAALEGGEEALSFSSGMAAIYTTLKAFLRPGMRIAYTYPCYGETHALISSWPGVEARPFRGLEEIRGFSPDVVFLETPSNPLLFSTDIRAVKDECDCTVVVDNTIASPVFQRPLKLGADVVVHSATKYLSGHSDVVAGVVISSSENIAHIREELFKLGNQLDPFAAWLVLRGVKSLYARMPVHWKNAESIAEFLKDHPKVKRVYYPAYDSVARRQMSGFSGLLSFEPAFKDIDGFIRRLKLFSFAVSLGAVESLVEVPGLMTHRGEAVPANLIRLSVGLEAKEDLIADLEEALRLIE